MFNKFNNPRFLGMYFTLLLLLPLVAIIGYSIANQNHGRQTLTCPTEHVDACVNMFKKHNKGTIRKMVGFRTDVVTFEVEPNGPNEPKSEMKN